MKERLKSIKSKIDAYAKEAVASQLAIQLEQWTSDKLTAIAHDFLAANLETYLSRHMNSSLEECLDTLEDLFEPPSNAAIHYTDPSTPNPFVDGSPEEVLTTDIHFKLLRAIVDYQVANSTTRIPTQKKLSESLNIKSLTLLESYNWLRTQGYIRGPERRKDKYSHIIVLKTPDDM